MFRKLILGAAISPDTRAHPLASEARPDRAAYIPTLDGWRALAVSLVIGEHSYNMLMNNGSRAARLLVALFTHGGYGVDIFFGLSGFLIGTLLLREKQRTGSISLSSFYLRRSFRILPPLFLYMAVVITLAQVHLLPHFAGKDLLSVFLFFRNYVPDGSWYTMHFWSLAVEEHFYIVIPLFLVHLSRRRAIQGVVLFIALCITIRCIEFWPAEPSTSWLRLHTENRIDGLLWGVLLALVMQSQQAREWLRARFSGWAAGAFMLAALGSLALFPFPPVHRSIVAIIPPMLIGYTVLHADGFAGRFLELPPLRWLGRISYGLYVWQMLFVVLGSRPLGVVQAFPLALLCPLACASLSYYFFERPMMRMGARMGMRLGHAAAAAPRLKAA